MQKSAPKLATSLDRKKTYKKHVTIHLKSESTEGASTPEDRCKTKLSFSRYEMNFITLMVAEKRRSVCSTLLFLDVQTARDADKNLKARGRVPHGVKNVNSLEKKR